MSKIYSKAQSLKERLGSDTKLPILGDFRHVSGVELLVQDIEQLLLTIPGERVYRPNFGSGLMHSLWENIEEANMNGQSEIYKALELFEPRITVLDIDSEVNYNTGLIIFTITFIINETDEQYSLVFPFRSGTQLSFS